MNKYDPKKIYIPILKAKTGELSALGDLSDEAKKRVVPLFEIPRVKWDFFNDEPAEKTEDLIKRVVPYIEKHWKEYPFFLDLYGDAVLSPGEENVDVASILSQVLQEKTLNYTPVISFDYSLSYNRSIVEKLSDNERGVALRVSFNPEVLLDQTDYDNLLKELDLKPEQVDIILDLGSVYGDKEEAVYLASRLVLAETPHLTKWRNLILAASSFPKTIGGVVEKNGKKQIERSEWLGWVKLAKLSKISRLPIFADYSISHPEVFDDIDPRHMRIAASIRYTTDNEWLLIKGEKLTGKESKGFGQFRELSQKILNSGQYHGADTSWGDKYIFECAEEKTTTGNLTTWRRVGNNQHFEYVIQQLAKIFENA